MRDRRHGTISLRTQFIATGEVQPREGETALDPGTMGGDSGRPIVEVSAARTASTSTIAVFPVSGQMILWAPPKRRRARTKERIAKTTPTIIKPVMMRNSELEFIRVSGVIFRLSFLKGLQLKILDNGPVTVTNGNKHAVVGSRV